MECTQQALPMAVSSKEIQYLLAQDATTAGAEKTLDQSIAMAILIAPVAGVVGAAPIGQDLVGQSECPRATGARTLRTPAHMANGRRHAISASRRRGSPLTKSPTKAGYFLHCLFRNAPFNDLRIMKL